MRISSNSSVRSGIVLAGGDGTRLRSFVQQLRREAIPKQYVNFIGTRSMFEHTFSRAEKLIPRRRLFSVVNENHLSFPEARRQIGTRPQDTVVIQPENKETAPGILLPLLQLHKQSRNAAVAILPSDHFILEEDIFVSYLAMALWMVERDPSRMILLGAEPTEAETEYGYILPGKSVGVAAAGCDLRYVERFIEKPAPSVARQLILRGALWNTMVLVAHAKTLLDLMRCLVPDLYHPLREISEANGNGNGIERKRKVYAALEPLNFSQAVLEKLPVHQPGCLSVLPMPGVFWSDWGSRRRLLNVLNKAGYMARFQGLSEEQLFKHWEEHLVQ
jgi:mannose-1-phosphate guanylyltransferase